MELELPVAELRNALAALDGVIERKGVIPILSHVLINAEKDHVALRGTDMDISMRVELCFSPAKKGAAALPAETLTRAAKAMRGEIAKVAKNGEGYRITSGGARFSLPTLPSSDYPKRPKLEEAHRFEMSVADLQRLLTRTAFAASTDATRYYLCGVHLVAAKDALRAEATNGHILARAECDLPAGADAMAGLVIPSKAVAAILRALKGRSDVLDVATDGKRLVVTVGDIEIDTRLIDCTFPDCDRVIPLGNDKIIRARVDALTEAIEVARVANNTVKIEVAEGGAVDVVGVGSDGKDARDTLPDVLCAHGPLAIGFNARYLLDHLGGMAGEEVTLELNDPASPAVIRDSGDSRWLGVIMPYRI